MASGVFGEFVQNANARTKEAMDGYYCTLPAGSQGAIG